MREAPQAWTFTKTSVNIAGVLGVAPFPDEHAPTNVSPERTINAGSRLQAKRNLPDDDKADRAGTGPETCQVDAWPTAHLAPGPRDDLAAWMDTNHVDSAAPDVEYVDHITLG